MILFLKREMKGENQRKVGKFQIHHMRTYDTPTLSRIPTSFARVGVGMSTGNIDTATRKPPLDTCRTFWIPPCVIWKPIGGATEGVRAGNTTISLHQNDHQQITKVILDMSVGVPGPPRTTSELTSLKTSVKNTPDAATLTLHALNLLKRPGASTYSFPRHDVEGLLFSWP